MQKLLAASLLLLGLSASAWAIDATNPSPIEQNPQNSAISTDALNELQTQIVSSFTQNDCARVSSMADRTLIPRFRPLVIAVIATCTSSHKKAENLFDQAEKKTPSDELILVLHARYLFPYNPEKSEKIWGKIYVIARNPALKKMAQDYLQGNEEEGATFSPISQKWTLFGSWETSGGYENNPTGQAVSIGQRPGSTAFNNVVYGSGTRTLDSEKTIGADVTITTNTYFSTHYADFWENDLDVPFTMRVGSNEDLIFRPLGRYSEYGGSTYEIMEGFALTGVAYRETYKQWVETAIFQNHYFVDVVEPESGTNIHFEYNWEFYPKDIYFRLMAYIQHVSAGEDTSITPGADIPYSHNDIGTTLYLDYRYRALTFSFYPSYSFRIDDNDSIYQDIFGNMVDKRRQDNSVDLKVRVSGAMSRSLEAFAYYNWTRTYSNMGFSDYLDRNYIDQSFGIGLKTFIANY
jgi:hypothetical protein